MSIRITKTVTSEGWTEISSVHVPETPKEVVEFLREEACVDERGMRRRPNWLDDEVFNRAAQLIEKAYQLKV